jgi:transcriptional regulator with XRE-family HTH domain
MQTKEILMELRQKFGLTQEQLAQKLFVTRQAVSRWENGETTPNTETLKQLSRLYHVSINTLLGSPQQLFCQCCGMPLDDGLISREPDGTPNEEYCKYCYQDAAFVYPTMESLVEYLLAHATPEGIEKETARAWYTQQLSTLRHWRK